MIIPRYLSEGTIGLDPEAYKSVYSSYDCPNNDMADRKNTVSYEITGLSAGSVYSQRLRL